MSEYYELSANTNKGRLSVVVDHSTRRALGRGMRFAETYFSTWGEIEKLLKEEHGGDVVARDGLEYKQISSQLSFELSPCF